MPATTNGSEHGHYSDHSTLADASADNNSKTVPELSQVSYRFETPEEVEGRRQRAIVSNLDTEESGLRPRTPPRRRPQVTSTGSISLENSSNTNASSSLVTISTMMDNLGDPDISSSGLHPGRPENRSVALASQPTITSPDLGEDSRRAAPRREDRFKALNALPGRRTDAPTHYDNLDDIGAQGPTRPVSGVEPSRRPKDHLVGYMSDRFVTDLQNYQPPQRVKLKNRRARRLFCF
ncbi:hypothetical protein HBI56_014440 [Parastagonospora nodorum]|nr:hypothetical protein HBI09_013290 [Parastagonospora nodorum]KAH4058701.1 hypothetical protein HBH49_036590 [Parastagonospora nodorum]KAH4304518.1 hypothetical protein HBI01_074250 [Parastagonospora nodorum]KAH4317436.1 hypothetical protein HBI02_026570 [Parastagonospora nodorum]KAH4329988.1 hypothetical protein HBI00_084390 [Parastagonospora nodorum]